MIQKELAVALHFLLPGAHLEEKLFFSDPVRVDVFCDEARIIHTDAVFARSYRLCQLVTALMTAVEYQFDKAALGCPVAL